MWIRWIRIRNTAYFSEEAQPYRVPFRSCPWWPPACPGVGQSSSLPPPLPPSSRVGKNPVFLFLTQPSGFFMVFLGFFGVFWGFLFFWGVLGILGFLGFFTYLPRRKSF
jgi:hypothetical protein